MPELSLAIYFPKTAIEEYRLRAKHKGINDLGGGYPEDSEFSAKDIISRLKLSGETVLADIGCENGVLIQNVFSKTKLCIGIVPTDEEAALLRKKFTTAVNVSIQTGVVTHTKLAAETADIVICDGILLLLANINEVKPALKEIHRVAKANAVVFIGNIPSEESDSGGFFRKFFRTLQTKTLSDIFRTIVQYSKAAFGLSVVIVPSKTLCIPVQQFKSLCEKSGFAVDNTYKRKTYYRKKLTQSSRNNFWLIKVERI